ncbi:HIT family protein [Spirochaetota bacterium]
MAEKCPFCSSSDDEVVLKNELAYAKYDEYPVNKGHILIIPFRHYSNYFGSTIDERNSLFDLVEECKQLCDKEYKPDGYNVGVNINESAGQTIFHVHIHLIPRYTGDMKEPRGGVRGVIPGKQKY